MEDSLRPAKKKRKKRTVIRLDKERAKRDLPAAPPPEGEAGAAVISFRKAVKRLRAAQRRRLTTAMPLSGDDTASMMLETIRHLRHLSDQQKTLARRNRIAMDELNQCAELVGQLARSISQMSLRMSTLEDEMSVISSELTAALRSNKRLKMQLERERNRK